MIRQSITIALLVLLVGCAGNRPGEETMQPAGVWETAWVDPEIVVSTDLLTVIKAARIDSFLVELTADSVAPGSGPTDPEVTFELANTDCRVAANVVDGHGRVVMPLLLQLFGPGHYRLTVNKVVLIQQGLPPGNYAVTASVCGARQVREFSVP